MSASVTSILELLKPFASVGIPPKLDGPGLLKMASALGLKLEVTGLARLAQVISGVIDEKRKIKGNLVVADVMEDERVMAAVDALNNPLVGKRFAIVRCVRCKRVAEIEIANPAPCECGFGWTTE